MVNVIWPAAFDGMLAAKRRSASVTVTAISPPIGALSTDNAQPAPPPLTTIGFGAPAAGSGQIATSSAAALELLLNTAVTDASFLTTLLSLRNAEAAAGAAALCATPGRMA